jgi:hypothetical protein
MISGVVAFAILIVLLIIIQGVILNPGGDLPSTVGNAISTAQPSQTTTTRVFEIKPNEIYLVSAFRDRAGIDPDSMYFARGEFSEDKYPDLVVDQTSESKYSYIKWNGTNNLRAKALVVCQQTAKELVEALDIVKGDNDNLIIDEPTDPETYCESARPCCAIILIRGN